MDPLTALLTLFAYERRTGKILTDQQIRDGELKNLLCAEDFESAEKVTTYSLLIHLYFRAIGPDVCPLPVSAPRKSQMVPGQNNASAHA